MLSDLHIHTSNSDGTDSLLSLKEKLKHNRITTGVLGITDHHYLTVEKSFTENGIVWVSGIEVSCEQGNLPCHLIGYAKKPKISTTLRSILQRVNDGYEKRAQNIYTKLLNRGYQLSPYSRLRDPKLPKPVQIYDIAHALGKTLKIDSDKEVRRWAKENGNLLYVTEEKYLPTAQQAISAMKESGFVVSWAHPWKRLHIKSDGDREVFHDYLTQLVELGLDGLEIYSIDSKTEDIEFYLREAKIFNLLIVGGSDYHGVGRGSNLPKLVLNEKYTEAFLDKLSITIN